MVRAFSVLLAGALLAGCAGSPPKTEQTPVPSPTTFAVLSVKGLVLPVAELPGGTKSSREGAFGLTDFASYENESAPIEVETVLRRNGFLSAYFREFELGNAGPNPLTSLIFVVLFEDSDRARSAMSELSEVRMRYGYHEMSLGGRIGDESRGMVANFGGSNTPAEVPISVADVLFVHSNAVVLARLMDDYGTLRHQDAITLAKSELAWLRH